MLDELFPIILNLHCKFDKIILYFNITFSSALYTCNKTQNPTSIKWFKKISLLDNNLLEFIQYIKLKEIFKILYDFSEINDPYQLYNKKLDIYLSYKKEANKKLNFKNLNENSNIRKLPIISISNNIISSSYLNLNLNFVPFISSLYLEPIKINFISFVKDLSMKIEIKNQENQKYLSNNVDTNGLAQLFIGILKNG